jgi:hypothetical protein
MSDAEKLTAADPRDVAEGRAYVLLKGRSPGRR